MGAGNSRIKAQEETKKTIDEKQDKLIEQLDKNQKALASNLEDIAMLQYTYEKPEKTTELPVDYIPSMLESDMDRGFDIDEIKKLTEYKLAQPSEVLKAAVAGNIDISDYDANVGKLLKTYGQKKGYLSKVKPNKKILTKSINYLITLH